MHKADQSTTTELSWRPLSYQMLKLKSVNRARNCGVQTLPFTMHYGGENRGRNGRILTANETELTFWVPDYGAKFRQN